MAPTRPGRSRSSRSAPAARSSTTTSIPKQEMLTKLRTNPGTYDVVLINSSYTQQAAKEGLIQPIDTSQDHQFEGSGAEAAGFPLPQHRRQDLWRLLGLGRDLLRLQHRGHQDRRRIRSRRSGIRPMPARSAGATIRWSPCSSARIATGQDLNNPADLDKVKAEAAGAEAAAQDLLVVRGRVEQAYAGRRLRHRHLLERLGRPQQEGLQSAGGVRGAEGRRHRLVRRPVHRGQCARTSTAPRSSSTSW